MNSTKTWFVVVATLAFLAGAVALVLPALSSVFGFLATAIAVYWLRRWPSEPSPGVGDRQASNPPRRATPPPTATLLKSSPPSASPAALCYGPGSSDPPASAGFGGYERVEKLAEGNMGTLWLVRHRQLERVAALKEIKGGAAGDDDLARFNREAQALSRLCSPHTIQIFDFGLGPEGFPYYVMEHLDGVDLQTLVDSQGPMPAARVIHVLRQLCESLEEAHEAGLVHRDIKPANIMLCHYGTTWDFAKLLDFGLVKGETNGTRASLTRAAVVLGTPAYLAPESLRGSKFVDSRADLYGLAAVGFYLLTGRLLFDHDNPVSMAKAHLLEPAPRAAAVAEAPVPRELDDLLDHCLSKDPDARPQSARVIRERLDAIPLPAAWSQEQARQCWDAAEVLRRKANQPSG